MGETVENISFQVDTHSIRQPLGCVWALLPSTFRPWSRCVLSVIRVPDLESAVTVVNSSEFGNTSSIFTNDAAVARDYCSRVEAGMVGVNVGVAAPMSFMPFTGWKGSFYGDLHAHGKDAARFYTEQKVITSRQGEIAGASRRHLSCRFSVEARSQESGIIIRQNPLARSFGDLRVWCSFHEFLLAVYGFTPERLCESPSDS